MRTNFQGSIRVGFLPGVGVLHEMGAALIEGLWKSRLARAIEAGYNRPSATGKHNG
jgi:hypothetical protein